MSALDDIRNRSSSTGNETPARLAGIDALRGTAILLMVLDHVLVLALATGSSGDLVVIRNTVTRLALPLFAGINGWLMARSSSAPSYRRSLTVLGWGVALEVFARSTGLFPWPDVLYVFAVTWLIERVAGRPIATRPAWALAVSLLVLTNTAMLDLFRWSGGGYPAPQLIAWMALGALLAGTCPTVPTWTGPRWVDWLGRHPLGVYVGHVVVLHVIYAAVR